MSEVAIKQDSQQDWRFIPIKDFAHITSGGTPRRGIAEYYNGDVPWVKSGDLNDSQLNSVDEFITELGLEKSSAKLFKPGTLLIALYGATIGRLSILNFEAASNQAVCGITLPEETDVKYVFYYLLSIRRKLISQGKGGAQPNINQQIVKETIVPLAPPEQQKRIVAKIEELFSHIDAGIEALKKAKQLLKQYRQSVLKAAITGELTKEWREENKDKLEPASQLLERILVGRRIKWEEQHIELFKTKGKMPKDDDWRQKYIECMNTDVKKIMIPVQWGWVSFDTLMSSDSPQNGLYKSAKYQVEEGETPLIDIKGLYKGYYASFKNMRRFKLSEDEVSKYLLREMDLLVNRVSKKPEGVGKAVVVKELSEDTVFESNMMRIELTNEVSAEFVNYVLNSGWMKNEVLKKAKMTQQASINQSDVKTLGLPLPSYEEQKAIVELIEERLLSMRRLEHEIDIQLIKAEKNKQSVLASVFSGELN